jgi:hypothetical protein
VVTKATRRRSTKGFYEEALTAAEKRVLAEARAVEGLDNEVALLRTLLRSALLQDSGKDLALMVRGLDALRRLVVARYGLGGAKEDALKAEEPSLLELLAELMKEVAHDGDPGNR